MGGDRGEGRGFREVDIAISSVLEGRTRLASFEDSEVPVPGLWRNNLTALSQEHNLYFVVHGDQIHAYEPEFPSQLLTERRFSWTVAASGFRATGIFRSFQSHWVNRMLLDYLGTEEVIATVHDDGDFVVCTVRSVRDAIEGVLHDGLSQAQAAARIRYIYKVNIGASAWGIAIHQQARLLAASCNSKLITVFLPALAHTGPWHDSLDVADRSEDRLLELGGHQANIPALSFCNTGADPEGRFLVSTDINGAILIWDIWKGEPIKKLTMAIERPTGFVEEEYPGWSVTCLDTKTFQCVDSDLALVGYERDTGEKSSIDTSRSHDNLRDFQITRSRSMSSLLGHLNAFRRQNVTQLGIDELQLLDHLNIARRWDEDDEMEDDEDDDDDENDEYEDGDADHSDLWDDAESPNNRVGPILEWGAIDYIHALPDEPFEIPDDFLPQSDDAGDALYDTIDFGPPIASDASSHEETFTGSRPVGGRLPPIHEPDLTPPARESPFKHAMYPPPAPQPPEPTIPFSILHTGQRIVTLLRPPFQRFAAKSIDPCREHVAFPAAMLEQYERLNLTAHIPELSVVVLATQRGRAAIFSLTELGKAAAAELSGTKDDIFSRAGRRKKARTSGSRAQDEDENEAGRFALRLDWVVPFKSQEARDERPWAPLIGIATSPIQYGAGEGDGGGAVYDGPRPRRWRLMLTYHDNSVLSYELSRGDGRGESLLVF